MRLTSPDSGLIDAVTLLSVCGGHQDLLECMAKSLASHAPRHLADLEQAIRQREPPRVRYTAHKLRGLVSAFSAAASEAAAELQQMGEEGRLERAEERCHSLARMVLLLCAALASVTVEDLGRVAVACTAHGGAS